MWEKDATIAFNRDLSALNAKRSAFNMEPFLRCIPVKDFVAIIVEEAKKMSQGSETYSPTATMLYRELGHKVYSRYRVLNKEKTGVLNKIYQIHTSYSKQYSALHPKLDVLPSGELKINTRQLWQNIEHSLKQSGSTLTMDHQEWVPTILKFIGKFLYHIVMHDLKVDVNSMKNLPNKNFIPAFYTIFRTQNRISKEEVKPHPVLAKLYRESISENLTFPTWELPMICPPLPWSSVNTGGYLISPSDLVRLPIQANSQKQKMLEVNVQQIYPSLDALNQLSAVPWKVNTKILDVILEVSVHLYPKSVLRKDNAVFFYLHDRYSTRVGQHLWMYLNLLQHYHPHQVQHLKWTNLRDFNYLDNECSIDEKKGKCIHCGVIAYIDFPWQIM